MIDYHGKKKTGKKSKKMELKRPNRPQGLPGDVRSRLAKLTAFVAVISTELSIQLVGKYSGKGKLSVSVEGPATDQQRWEIKKYAAYLEGFDLRIGRTNVSRAIPVPIRTGDKGCKKC